jgi:hypothetical protein
VASLVSQDEALRQLRLVEAALTPDQIADVNFKAEQASAIISDYCKVPFIDGPLPPPTRRAPPAPLDFDDLPPAVVPPWDWDHPVAPSVPPIPPEPWTPATVPVLAKAAILVVLTSLYDGRTPEDALLSDQVTGILWRLRDPALA